MDSQALLSLVRAPTELAEERSAISDNLDATSAMSKNQLGSSLQPLPMSHHPVTDVVVTDEAVLLISSCMEELNNLTDFGRFRKKIKNAENTENVHQN